MNILADFHHSSLYSSLLYTLETRLGYSVYRPIGEEWFKKGYWRVNRQNDTIQQYLGTFGYIPSDGTPPLNNVSYVQDGIYYSTDPNTGQVHKAIAFDKFTSMKFDYLLCSMPQHLEPFYKLQKNFQPEASVILQMGNNWAMDWYKISNLMASTMPFKLPKEVHSVFYHQEFDLNIFKPTQTKPKKIIANFMNVLHNYPEASETFAALEKELPEYTFKMYGSQNRDGCVTGVQNIAQAMQEAMYIFHIKPGGDGYGHVVHNAFACGVPLITKKSFYEGHLAGQMMDDRACILTDGLSVKDLATIIRAREEQRDNMSQLAYQRFTDIVNFEKEAHTIDEFLKKAK
jgi:hypothetical protein